MVWLSVVGGHPELDGVVVVVVVDVFSIIDVERSLVGSSTLHSYLFERNGVRLKLLLGLVRDVTSR